MASSSRPFLFRVAGIPMSLTRYAARNEDFVLVCARLLSYDGPTAYGSGLTGCARRRAPARERRGALGSPQATEPGGGAEPHVSQLPRLDGVTGCARRRAPARERRGALGSPQATEPGCGAEPHVNWSVLLLGA